VLVLDVDTKSHSAKLVRSYSHPKKLLAPFEGNAQFLPNGDVFVGWGAIPYFSEFDARGRVLLDASFGGGKARIKGPNEDADSYRVFKFVWQGHPTDRPAVKVVDGKLYVSWNGATEVRRWRVLAGPEAGRLTEVATAVKKGFETVVDVRAAKFFAVRALDANGRTLGQSRTVEPTG
jgi:hypothetical protein